MMSEKKVVRYKLVRHKWPDEIEAEKKQRKRRIGIIALCVIFFFSGYGLNRFLSRSDVTNDKTFAKLSEVYTIMKNKFYFGKDKEDFNEQLINGAIKGMVDAGGDQAEQHTGGYQCIERGLLENRHHVGILKEVRRSDRQNYTKDYQCAKSTSIRHQTAGFLRFSHLIYLPKLPS